MNGRIVSGAGLWGRGCERWREGLRLRTALLLVLSLFALVPPNLLPATAQDARACSEGFATWVKRSQETLKTQPKRGAQPGDAAKEACVPNEGARKSLQRGLESVRRRCQGADAASNDVVATLPILEINADALTTMPVCSGAQIAGKQPIPQTQECLSLELNGGVYWLSNVNCSGQKIITVVEIKLSSGILKCRGHIVTKTTKLGTTKPIVNYECIQNERDCSMKSVKAIFPYCAW